MGDSKSLENEEDLAEAKKTDELEIKNLMESYNSMIAEKKRLRKLKRKEAAPPKKGRLRKLMDPDILENETQELKVEAIQHKETKNLIIQEEEENQF